MGGSEADVREIMEHPFFASIDWGKVYRKEVQAPFVPNLSDEEDIRYFDQEFTREPVQLTPPPMTNGNLETLDEMDEDMQSNFKAFVFHNYSSSLTNNGPQDEDVEMAVD